MEIKPVFEKINFAYRYRDICDQYNNFEGRMRGSKKLLYDNVLSNFGYNYKYYSNGSFYQIKEENDKYIFQDYKVNKLMQLV